MSQTVVIEELAAGKNTDIPECAEDTSTLCSKVWDLSEKHWLAESSHLLIAKPATIIGILIGALVVRWLTHRAIHRVARSTATGKVPVILRPLKERAPTVFQEATGLMSERREQRAAAIGSVLRSVATVAIFAIAGMMVLDELGLNLAPILASAGIVGIALGFGAQTLVKDVLSGVFMLLEDQYGMGDIVDLGEASGTVEAVGLRITTMRDVNGVVWYVRNGEVIRVGNKSQGWAVANVDVPLQFGTDVELASDKIREAVEAMATDEQWLADFLEPPEVLGVEQMTSTGMLLRVTAKVTSDAQWRVARELRARIGASLDAANISYGIPVAPITPDAK